MVTASRMRACACDTAFRLCVRTVVCWSAFSLVPPLGSTCSSAARAPLRSQASLLLWSESDLPLVRSSSATGLRPSRRGPCKTPQGQSRDIPVPEAWGASAHARVYDDAEPTSLCLAVTTWAELPLLRVGKHPRSEVGFRLNGWPTLSPVNASLRPSRVAAHDSGGGVVRYAFTAEDFHLIPPAGLPAHPSTPSREEAARSGAERGVLDRARPKRRGPRVQYSRAIAIRSADGSSKSRASLRALRPRLEPAWSQAGAHRSRNRGATIKAARRGLRGAPALRRAVTHAREENNSDPARKHLSITSAV